MYVEELNRIVLKDKATFSSFSNASATRKVRHNRAPEHSSSVYKMGIVVLIS